MRSPALLRVVCLLALALGVAAVFAPVLRFPFVEWDDDIHITENPFLPGAAPGDWGRFWREPYRGLYVPVTYSVWPNYKRIPPTCNGSLGR